MPTLTDPDLRALLGLEEGERVEFKRAGLDAKGLAEYAVGIGNSGGGILVLGVGDQQPREIRGLTDHAVGQTVRSRQAVLNATRIRIEVVPREIDGRRVALVHIPARPRGQVFHTADGKYLMRVGESLVGMPEAEVKRIHREEASHLDVLAAAVPGDWHEHVSLVELDRLRGMLRENQRDELARLSDDDLLGALEVFTDEAGRRAMTRAGVLLVGTPEAIRRFVPFHEVKLLRFGADPLTPMLNEDHRTSLVQCIERADAVIAAVNTVESFQAGLFRVDLPRFPRLAWREALANALAHRDYGEPGSVAVRLYEDRLELGSPGGWFGGVSEANVLHTEPRRRNELLAAVMQKVGLAERSAVGVKRMFRAMLLGGKRPPAYRSTPGSVTVALDSRTIDRTFGSLAHGAWGEDRSLGVEDLLVLALLRRQRHIRTPEVALEIQRDANAATDTLERLAERDLVVRHGVGRGRSWTLGAEAYR